MFINDPKHLFVRYNLQTISVHTDNIYADTDICDANCQYWHNFDKSATLIMIPDTYLNILKFPNKHLKCVRIGWQYLYFDQISLYQYYDNTVGMTIGSLTKY